MPFNKHNNNLLSLVIFFAQFKYSISIHSSMASSHLEWIRKQPSSKRGGLIKVFVENRVLRLIGSSIT